MMETTRISRGGAEPSARIGAGAAPRSPSGADAGRPAEAAPQSCLDALPIAAAVVALDEGQVTIVAHNRAFARLTTAGQLGPIMAEAADLLLADAAEDRQIPFDEPIIGGRHFHVHLSRLPPLGPLGARAMISLIDRTAEIETERSLRAEMLHDSLTGLPNRVAFIEAIDAAIADDPAQCGFAVLAVDLTRFSRINECVGALAGDELIITVARRLVSALGPGDMLARMAGDEFGVLLRLPDGPGDVRRAARRLIAALAAPIRLSELEIRTDCAIGCALWSERAPTSADLLRKAQVALKRAKRTGCVEVYQAGEAGQAGRRFSLETDLRRAIEADQLSLAFQPLVRLEDGSVGGFEVLARWIHPDQGSISPTEFIAVAEDSGLIVPLGRWVLHAAMQTLARWDVAAGRTLPLYLGVNVSPVQLVRDSVCDAVRSALADARIGGGRLTIELTESSIVADPGRAKRVLDQLQAIDCRIAMDDFGTGYSSLASLQKLPIDILKIDRSFVTGMLEDRDSIAIVRAILSLADALGMSTTAEGIETVELARMLAALGCTIGQGYHFARPLSAEAALAYFHASAPPLARGRRAA